MSSSAKDQYCIALQPICDASLHHIGDELLYRSDLAARGALIFDEEQATARVFNAAFYETGIDKLVGNRQVFVNMPTKWLLEPEHLPPHPQQLVIEVLETVAVDSNLMAALRKIRSLGFRIALDDFVLTPETRPLVDVADIVKVDTQHGLDEPALDYYRAKDLVLLAEKVEEYADYTSLREAGFSLFQGYFYARPETHRATARHRSSNRAALIHILTELQRDDINFRTLESLITQDPELTFQLLKYTNSALFHHAGTVTDITQVLNVLGVSRVRSVTLTILLANNGPASRLLLSQALTRAAMCAHLMGERAASGGEAFTAGLISMMDVLLGEPLNELLAELPLDSVVVEALLNRQHALGFTLDRIEAFEQGAVSGWNSQNIEDFNQVWLDSQVWATQTLAAINQLAA